MLGLLQLEFVLSINLSEYTEGVTHPHSCSCAHALPKRPLISVRAWLPQGDPDRPMARDRALMLSPQAPMPDAPCETGTGAAHGLLKAAAETWSSLGLSLLYCEYFFCIQNYSFFSVHIARVLPYAVFKQLLKTHTVSDEAACK